MRADKVVLGKTLRYRNQRPAARYQLIRVRIVGIGESSGAGSSLRTRNFLCEVNEHCAQMFTVPKKIFGASRTGEKKGEDVLVSLLHVAGRAGKHEVVTSIVCTLPFARCHVIESDSLFADATTTVRANWPVPVEQPFARVGIRVPARRQRSALMSWTLDSFSRATAGTHATNSLNEWPKLSQHIIQLCSQLRVA